MDTITIYRGLRWVIRDGEKVLQHYHLAPCQATHFPNYTWQDVPLVDEKTGEEIEEHEPNTGR